MNLKALQSFLTISLLIAHLTRKLWVQKLISRNKCNKNIGLLLECKDTTLLYFLKSRSRKLMLGLTARIHSFNPRCMCQRVRKSAATEFSHNALAHLPTLPSFPVPSPRLTVASGYCASISASPALESSFLNCFTNVLERSFIDCRLLRNGLIGIAVKSDNSAIVGASPPSAPRVSAASGGVHLNDASTVTSTAGGNSSAPWSTQLLSRPRSDTSEQRPSTTSSSVVESKLFLTCDYFYSLCN